MGLYYEYQEETDTRKTYLYKFPKDEEQLDAYNDVLNHHMLPFSLAQEGRFVVLQGADRGEQPEQLQHQLSL